VAVIGTYVLTNLVFWSLNAMLMIIDLTGSPKFLLQFKIQPDKNVPLEKHRLISAVKVVLFNTTIIGIPSYILFWYLASVRGCSFSGPVSTFHWFLFEFVVFILTEEIGFYYTHRLLHHRFFYKYIHKMHHEWTASIGIVSLYAHPLEHFLSNYFPIALGPLLMGSHIGVVWIWFCTALASTTNAHSGYHFPFFPSPEAHDYHHFKFTNNFGVLGILDRLHGTDDDFRRTKAYARHWMMLSLTPPRELVPDEEKKVTVIESSTAVDNE